MTSPRTLFLSLAATVCAFALVLIVIASQVSIAATSEVAAQAPSTVSIVAQEINTVDSVTDATALAPAASR